MFIESHPTNLINLITQKDAQGRYLYCNDQVLSYAQLEDQQQIIGKTNAELPWQQYANIYQEHDCYTLNHDRHMAIVPFIDHQGVEKLLLEIRHRIPLYKQSFGIACYAIVIEEEAITQKNGEDQILSQLNDREIACFYYLIKGQCAKHISRHLSISSRTVEKYTRSIRQKIGCKSKKEIVSYALQKQYIHVVN